MEFRRKITFCCHIYYLTVSQNEYCVPSALWGRCRGADWWGAALRFASCPNLCKGSFPLSWSVWHMDAALSNLSLSGYDFNVASVLWTFTAALHFTLRPALRCHRFWNSDWCSPTFPLSRCHCVKFNASVCHYPLWLEDSATVAAFEENWLFSESNRLRGCGRHWAVKPGEWFSWGCSDAQLRVRRDVWSRSKCTCAALSKTCWWSCW